MKVLLVTTPLGQGHNAVAQALGHHFRAQGIECVIMDMYEYVDPILKEIISKGFLLSMKSATYLKAVVSELYDLNEKRDMNWEFFLSRFTNALLASELKKFITSYQPDLTICTQVYAAQVVDILKEKKAIETLCVGIVTDYTVQTYWSDVEYFEYINVPSERLAYQLAERGIEAARILNFGMPIEEKFAKKVPKESACEELGLVKGLKTVLIMGGGTGLGNIEKYVEEIDQQKLNLQILVVCGKNERLYRKLKDGIYKKPTKVFGYVNNMEILMAAADCMVSKPGGISTAEALAVGVPLIMVDSLPGVEERNVEFLLNNGGAILASKTYSLTEAIMLLFEHEERRRNLQEGMATLARPEATKQLCEFLIERVKVIEGD